MAQVDAFNPDGSMSRGKSRWQTAAKWKSFNSELRPISCSSSDLPSASREAAIVNGVVDAGTVVKTHSIKRQWLIESAVVGVAGTLIVRWAYQLA
jgi:hypothetical protein